MHKKKVLITITGQQNIDENIEEIQLVVSGLYYEKNGIKYLEYEEYDKKGLDEKIKCTIKINKNNSINLNKTGKYGSKLILEKKQHRLCLYGTEFGNISMGVYTSNISCYFEKNNATIHATYTLDLNSKLISTNKILINIKETNNQCQ